MQNVKNVCHCCVCAFLLQVSKCILKEVRGILKAAMTGPSSSGTSGDRSIPPHSLHSILVATLPALEDTPLMAQTLGLDSKALNALIDAGNQHSNLLK